MSSAVFLDTSRLVIAYGPHYLATHMKMSTKHPTTSIRTTAVCKSSRETDEASITEVSDASTSFAATTNAVSPISSLSVITTTTAAAVPTADHPLPVNETEAPVRRDEQKSSKDRYEDFRRAMEKLNERGVGDEEIRQRITLARMQEMLEMEEKRLNEINDAIDNEVAAGEARAGKEALQ